VQETGNNRDHAQTACHGKLSSAGSQKMGQNTSLINTDTHGSRANRCRATERGYDADWFREALQNKGITPCIPGRKSRTKPVKYDKRRYKHRNSLLSHVNMRCPVIDQNHAWSPERLASRGYALRKVPESASFCHRPRRNHLVLALKINEIWSLERTKQVVIYK